VLTLVLAWLAGAAGASEPVPPGPDHVVVTGERTDLDVVPAADFTAFATVIDTSDAPREVTSLADVLSESVGVQVRRFGGLGAFSTLSVRGFSPGQVQIYFDGVPLTRADNETVNLGDLPIAAFIRASAMLTFAVL
jgi:iron complex outermembrane receptor protein